MQHAGVMQSIMMPTASPRVVQSRMVSGPVSTLAPSTWHFPKESPGASYTPAPVPGGSFTAAPPSTAYFPAQQGGSPGEQHAGVMVMPQTLGGSMTFSSAPA